MISKRWRERLTYTAMSLLVAWHTLAMVVAPAPSSSVIAQAIRPLLQPYYSLLYLNNTWGFYAPGVDRGRQFRYVIEDSAGKHHTFVPIDELNWFHPNFWWFRVWYVAIMDFPDRYGDFAAASLCRKHASLQPISITLLGIQQEDFSRDDHLSGKHPLDSDFITVTTLKTVECLR